MEHAADYSGFDADDALYLFSSEAGTIYDSRDGAGKYFRCGARLHPGSLQERGSRLFVARMLRTPPLDEKGEETGCADLAQLSDRIQVSARVDRDSSLTNFGYVDLEIRARHGVSATPLFRAQFNIAQLAGLNPPEWLVTISGFVATEWEIHVSYVPQAGTGDPTPGDFAAQVMISASVDRCCVGPLDGLFRTTWNEALVTNNTFAPILPRLSLDFATNGTQSLAAYTPGVPNWDFGFIPDGVAISLIDPNGTDELMISFDGVTDHIRMVPGTPTASVSFPTSRHRLFARSPSGNAVAYQILATRRGGTP